MAYIQVLSGLVLLGLAGDFLVRGSVLMARQFNISPLIIGLTIVAFGTSAPELAVSIDAVLAGVPTLALGNVVGSNIANTWLVLGVPVILSPMICNVPNITKNLVIMIGVTVLFIAMAFMGPFTYINGFILLTILAVFLWISGKKATCLGEVKKTEGCDTLSDYELAISDIEGIPEKPDNFTVSTFLVIGGFAGLLFGALILVEGSISVARELGVSEAVIGLTIVAIGTSIPELVTAIVASLKGHCEVAIGNVIGSNIFNLLGIIGVSSLFGDINIPISFQEQDLWIMLFAALTLLPFAIMKCRIGRRAGIGFTSLYIFYIFNVAHSATHDNMTSTATMGLAS